jgi:putative transcriptional regulator
LEDSDNILIKALGKRISILRKERALTQLQMSDLAEMEESALRRIELGGTNPTFKTLLKISRALKISLKELLDFPEL